MKEESQNKIDDLQTQYLRELSSLSKIFISLAIGIIGLTMSDVAPDLSQKEGIKWIIGTWAALLLCAFFGFYLIYSFSSRFRAFAHHIYYSTLAAAFEAIDRERQGIEKIKELLSQAEKYRTEYDKRYDACIRLVKLQAIFLLIALGCFGTFMYSNYFPPCK